MNREVELEGGVWGREEGFCEVFLSYDFDDKVLVR